MLKILIVEDNIKLRKKIKEILESRLSFVRITEAGDGKKTFTEIEKYHPDVIFMDIKLSRENGLKLTEKIKKQYPQIIIVINTSYDSPEYRGAVLKLGAEYFLSKKTNNITDIVVLVESIYFKATCKCPMHTI